MAQEFIPIAENDIGALAEDRTAAKVRAVDDQGNSVNLTTAQTAALVLTDANKDRIQELAGIDYSKGAEQIMSGVFWPDINGVPKQVYARAFRGTTAPNYSIGYIIITPISESPIHTSCSLHMMVCNIKGTSTNTYEGVYLQNANKGLQLIMVDAASYSRRSQPFVAIVLYTK